jgi:serine/threonine protein kinase/alpha-tubulin suppressor-like RCC1 family protein
VQRTPVARMSDDVREPTPTPAAQDVGDITDEYTLLGELGRGGSAIVYRARDRALFRDVAIKVVRPRFAANADDAIERLEREARTVARLQHPNIVTVHAVKRLRDGGLALVMQYVPGRTLKQAVQEDGPFDAERAERVLKDIAQALAFAHHHGVVHRDVKPENVFLDSATGRALLSDFGIAYSNEFESRLTMTGAAIGTPAYMAPEQIDGAPANARSDVYSLGLVAWEMLTGHRPWEGEALYNVIFKQKHEELPAIDAVRPGAVPQRLQYIVERMLQKKPAARWAGADGLLGALDAWVVPSDWRQWEESHRRRREREKANPRPALKRDLTSDATVRFARPVHGDGTPDATEQAIVRVTPATPVVPVPAVADEAIEDDAPSWASEPEETPPARSGARPWLMAALLLLVVSGGGYAMYARQQARTPVAPAGTLSDAREIVLPVVPPDSLAPDSAASMIAGADSASVSALDQQARDSVAFNAAVQAQVARAQLSVDSVRTDSINAAALRRAERRAARMMAAAAAPVSAAAAPNGAPPAPSTPSVRATDDPGVIAAGGRHSCALVSARVLCWGANDHGQLGDGDTEARGTPAPIVGELEFVQLSTGLAHSCGVVRGGDAFCWGADERGQLGDATFTSRSAPVRVSGNQRFALVRTGQYHSCGLTTAGDAYCWGANSSGQLGDGTTSTRSTPVAVSGGQRFVSLSAGWNHSCGIAIDGSAWCWGENGAGQVGNGTRNNAFTPVQVGGSVRFTAIAAGSTHSCAVSTDGVVHCWGRNSFGQLGIGSSADQVLPMPVASGTRFVSVTLGGVHSCARTRGGQAWCWGRNVYGQVGDGSTASRDVPTRVMGPASFTSLNASGAHTCGTTGDDGLWCWGFNVEGQLGDGTRNHLSRPTRVTLPGR